MSGKSHFLVRIPKQSRDKKQIGELEEEKKETDRKIDDLNNEIDSLRRKIEQFENDQMDHEENLEKLSNLFKLGIIDENGLPINDDIQ